MQTWGREGRDCHTPLLAAPMDDYGSIAKEEVGHNSRRSRRVAAGVVVLLTLLAVASVASLGGRELLGRESLEAEGAKKYYQTSVFNGTDPTQDPCNDFYNYACGDWEKGIKLKPDSSSRSFYWHELREVVEGKLHAILLKSKSKTGKYFRSCLDRETINKEDNARLLPYFHLIETVKDMPSLLNVSAILHKNSIATFFDWYVSADLINPVRHALFIQEGGVSLPDTESYHRTSAHATVLAFQESIYNLSLAAGFNHSEALRNANTTIRVETELSAFFLAPSSERHHLGDRVTVAELDSMSPAINMTSFFTAVGFSPDPKRDVFVRNKAYLRKLSAWIVKQDPKELIPYMRWRALSSLLPYLGEKYTDLALIMQKYIDGVDTEMPRWKKCYQFTKSAMPQGIAKLYVEEAWDDRAAAVKAGEDIVSKLKTQFRLDLLQLSWMSNVTKQKAIAKLDVMFDMLGVPKSWKNYTFEIGKSFTQNTINANVWTVHDATLSIHRPVDRYSWGSNTAADLNSFYDICSNGLFIAAAMMQPPFLRTKGHHLALNFGALGSIMGHEMTHGFDDVGRSYGPSGSKEDWWTKDDKARFDERAQCIAKHYSSYTLDGLHINGNLTLGEDIADMGGIKLAYRAFLKELSSVKSVSQVESGSKAVALPAMHENSKRDFFIAYAQMWCSVERKTAEKIGVRTSVHPPSHARVNAPLSQFEGFAETYGCPVGSPMNPKGKHCELW